MSEGRSRGPFTEECGPSVGTPFCEGLGRPGARGVCLGHGVKKRRRHGPKSRGHVPPTLLEKGHGGEFDREERRQKTRPDWPFVLGRNGRDNRIFAKEGDVNLSTL